MSNYSTQIKRIKEKFNQAKGIDSEFKVFGASSHQYQLGRTVTAKEIEKFETKYNITLPQAYKVFIQETSGISAFKPKRNQADKLVPAPDYGLFTFDNIFDHTLTREFEDNMHKPSII